MRRDRTGDTKIVLRSFDTKEALEEVFSQDPKPEVRWVIVPRVAFEFAYWPIGRQANERLLKIRAEGRQPTFEEVEGDVSKAWEIFEDEGPQEEGPEETEPVKAPEGE